jgi:predicted deacylase
MRAMPKWPAGIHQLRPTISVHVLEGTRPGPTALVQAGIHGDEIAGVHALSELLEEGIRPESGRLLIVPVMNPAAYRARQRMAPGGLDMNRCFPGDASSEAFEKRLARDFMDLVEVERPALVMTLHESLKRYHPAIPASFGQTVVYGVNPMPSIIAQVIDRLNETRQSPYELWAPHHYPVATSSTEVIVDRIGCVGVCVETWMGFEEARRVAMQRQTVQLFLEELGILARI